MAIKSRALFVLSYVGFHHVLMAMLAVAIVTSSLVLAGSSSTSPFLPSIYLASLSYVSSGSPLPSSLVQLNGNLSSVLASQVTDVANLELRIGFFGICLRSASFEDFTCSRDAQSLAAHLTSVMDPLNLLWQASRFRTGVLFPYLIVIAIIAAFTAVALLNTVPGWHKETSENESDIDVKPFASPNLLGWALVASFLSALLLLVSAVWLHSSAVAFVESVRNSGYGTIGTSVGTTSIVLGWLSLVLAALATCGVLLMAVAIKLVKDLEYSSESDNDTMVRRRRQARTRSGREDRPDANRDGDE